MFFNLLKTKIVMNNRIVYYKNYLEKLDDAITQIELNLWNNGNYKSIDKQMEIKLKKLKDKRTKLMDWSYNEKLIRYRKENNLKN